jgi:hypothetical protein
MSMLAHPEPALRAAAVFFLGLVPGGADSLTRLGELAQRDPSVEMRATATVTLGLLARAGRKDAEELLEQLVLDDSLLKSARWAGRVIAGLATSAEEDAAGAAGWFSARWAATPWCSASSSARWIRALVPETNRRAVVAPAIVKSFVAAGGPQSRQRAIAELALELAGFKANFNELEVVAAERLDDGQRQTAAALMEMPNVVLALRWGLPGSARAIGKWLELSPPSPLEAKDKGGQRRWQRVRAVIADGRPSAEVIETAMADLTPLEKLQVAQELLMGAYKILLHAETEISPAALNELATAAGKDAVSWAESLVSLAAAWARESLNPFSLLHAHLFVAFKVMVRAKVALEPDWDDAIGVEPPDDARLVLEAISPERRASLLMRRLDRYPPAGQGFLIAKTMPLMDLVASPALIARFKTLMSSQAVSDGAGPDTAQKVAALP